MCRGQSCMAPQHRPWQPPDPHHQSAGHPAPSPQSEHTAVLQADEVLRSCLLAPLHPLIWIYFPALPLPVSSEAGRVTGWAPPQSLDCPSEETGSAARGLTAQEGSPRAAGMLGAPPKLEREGIWEWPGPKGRRRQSGPGSTRPGSLVAPLSRGTPPLDTGDHHKGFRGPGWPSTCCDTMGSQEDEAQLILGIDQLKLS